MRILLNLPEYFVMFCVILISMAVVLELFMRNLLELSVFGYTNEITFFLFVWVSMMGAAIGVKRGSHFIFAILSHRAGPRTSNYLSIFSSFVIILFAIVLVTAGLKAAIISRNEVFIAIQVSRFWATLSVPVSGAVMLFYAFVNLRSQIRSMRELKHSPGFSENNKSPRFPTSGEMQ